MAQKMRFGVVLGQLATLKKKLGINYGQLLRAFINVFRGKKTTFF